MCFKKKNVKVKASAKGTNWLCVLFGHVWTYKNGKRVCSRCGYEG